MESSISQIDNLNIFIKKINAQGVSGVRRMRPIGPLVVARSMKMKIEETWRWRMETGGTTAPSKWHRASTLEARIALAKTGSCRWAMHWRAPDDGVSSAP
jgi:hypothetical protein